LRRILVNPRYAGFVTYRGEVLRAGDWDAILDETTHRALVSRLSDPARRTAPTNARKYLLSGLVRCGRCGEAMYASPMGRKGEYWMVYRCRKSHLARRLDLIDNLIIRLMVARLSKPDALGLMVSDNRSGADNLRQQANGIRARLETLAVDYADGAITAAQLRSGTERLRERLAEVEKRQAGLVGAQALRPLVTAPDVRRAWDRLGLGEKRAAIDTLMAITILPSGKGVRFNPDQVRVDWR
jgi:site-specific DNA recombinase